MSISKNRKVPHSQVRAGRAARKKKRIPNKRPIEPGRKAIASRFRNVIFTVPNPSVETRRRIQTLADPTELDRRMKYIVLQEEECPKTGTPHLQGYCEFKTQMRFNAIKESLFGAGTHIERRMGTQKQAIEYCKKPETRIEGGLSIELGTPNSQGTKGTFVATCDNVAYQISMGDTLAQIEDDYPGFFLMNKQKVVDGYIEQQEPRNLQPNNDNVHIFVGPSGSGKSTTAKLENPDAYLGQWPTGGRWWWPNYRGEEAVIFDEFRENISYQQMLALLDIHPMGIEYKGGNCQMISKKIIITTIRDPSTWYKKVQDKTELARRIRENTTIFDFKGGAYPTFNKVARDMTAFEFEIYTFADDGADSPPPGYNPQDNYGGF